VVPWRDWSEWEAVRRLLFSDATDDRAEGIARVKAWRARGRVPVAIDSSASLIEVCWPACCRT
jgi:ribosomal biogenesis protein LAS1